MKINYTTKSLNKSIRDNLNSNGWYHNCNRQPMEDLTEPYEVWECIKTKKRVCLSENLFFGKGSALNLKGNLSEIFKQIRNYENKI